jgi:hypothetical protein
MPYCSNRKKTLCFNVTLYCSNREKDLIDFDFNTAFAHYFNTTFPYETSNSPTESKTPLSEA